MLQLDLAFKRRDRFLQAPLAYQHQGESVPRAIQRRFQLQRPAEAAFSLG